MSAKSVVIAIQLGIAVLAIPPHAAGQAPEHPGEIEGIVLDATTGEPLAGAVVTVVGASSGAVTHADGSFHLRGLRPGPYTIRLERLGYRTQTVEVTAGAETSLVRVELETAAIDIGGLVVTGALSERGADEALRPVNVMTGQELQRNLQSTIAATLRSEPGLAATTMGPATARPVIRGLSGDRVLMLEDGVRVGDVSSSGGDHATALDPSSARRIEVVRGPAALLYGSNALGGVINVIRDEVPTSVPHHVTGSATLQSQSVNSGYAASVSGLAALSDRIPVRSELTLRTSGDLTTPMGELGNTWADTWSAGLGSAYVGEGATIGGAFRAYQNDYGIPGGFVGGHEEGVRVEMERTSSKVTALLADGPGPFETIEVDGAYTWYRHREIEPPNILGTFFKRQTFSTDVLGRHASVGPFSSGALGFRVSREAFDFAGDLSTPNTRRTTVAGYLFEEIDLHPLRLETGVRYDWVRADPVVDDPDADIGAIGDRTFSAASGSIGLLLDAGGGVIVGTSLARAFRTPDVNELYSSGPHLAAYVFEVGNPSLGTEVGTGVDGFVRFSTERVQAELTGFYNSISGYVFGEETGELSPVLLPIYQFQGADATLRGVEGALEAALTGSLKVDGTVSYVKGSLDDGDAPLPLMPPLRGRAGLEADRPGWFARAEVEMSARQDRVGEFETPTDGYTVANLSAGVRVTLGGRLHVLSASVENLTDAEYRNHLSRVKEIMPEAGRNLSLTYRVVF